MVRRIVALAGADESLIEHVTDRPGHDRRYSLSSDKVRALGWEPRVRLDDGLAGTVDWYRDNACVVGADPLGRVPRVLRAPVRARAGRRPGRVSGVQLRPDEPASGTAAPLDSARAPGNSLRSGATSSLGTVVERDDAGEQERDRGQDGDDDLAHLLGGRGFQSRHHIARGHHRGFDRSGRG